MGKKAKFKAIRKIVETMPEIKIDVPATDEVLKGSTLIKNGVTEVKGKPVVPGATYVKKSIKQQPLNHNRKMKELYKKQGIAGVNRYINAVSDYAAKHQVPSKVA